MNKPFAIRRPCLAVGAGLLALVLACPTVWAAGKKKAAVAAAATKSEPAADASAADGDKEQAKVKIERGAGGKKIYKIEGEIVIEGKIQKPEAFYVLQKSSINYDWHELKQEFVPKILDSVTKTPF